MATVNNAHKSFSGDPSIIGVIGTLGTSDTGGTALTLPIAVQPATGAQYVWIAGTDVTIGGGGGTNVNVVTGTITTGTLQNLVTGTINALASGTITGGTLQSGTIGLGTVVGKDASGSAPTGNPVLIGGFDGVNVQRLSTNTSGQLQVDNVDMAENITGADAASNSTTSVMLYNRASLFNGASWDRVRGVNSANNTVGTGLLGAGILGQDSGGTYHSLAITTGGSIGTIILPNIPGGTIGNLVTGTLNALASGTITGGTLQNLVTGTINALASGTISGGTIQNLNAGTITAVTTVTTVSNLTNGSVTMQVGTLTTGTLQNLATGTVNALASGTISTGTLSPIPTIANSTFGTIGTTGATVFGTLAGGTGSGAGTEIFVTSVSISSPASAGSQDVSVGFGTNGGTFHAGTGRLVRGMFPAGGGIQKSFWPPINSGTNAQLAYFQAGAGTIEVDVTYFVTASTL